MENANPRSGITPESQAPEAIAPAPAGQQQSPPSTEATVSGAPTSAEAPVTEEVFTHDGTDSAAGTAPESDPAAESTQTGPESASSSGETPAFQDHDNDPRYNNKYAKQHRSDLDRLPDGPEKNYLLDRVFPQMAYYSKASGTCKKIYYHLTLLCIIFNGIIPFIMLFEEFTCLARYVKFAVTALSSAAGILTAIVALKKHRELWIQYRICLEQLKRAVSMYFLGVGDFDHDQKPEERARTLFAVCENILSAEHNQWTELNKEKKDD